MTSRGAGCRFPLSLCPSVSKAGDRQEWPFPPSAGCDVRGGAQVGAPPGRGRAGALVRRQAGGPAEAPRGELSGEGSKHKHQLGLSRSLPDTQCPPWAWARAALGKSHGCLQGHQGPTALRAQPTAWAEARPVEAPVQHVTTVSCSFRNAESRDALVKHTGTQVRDASAGAARSVTFAFRLHLRRGSASRPRHS